MNLFIHLTKRHIKLYLRDKSTVLISFISSFIILALFGFFMGKAIVDNTFEMISAFGNVERNLVQALVFTWVLGGIIVLNSISIPQMMLSRIILDKESKIVNDLYVVPFKRSILGLSYVASALFVGTIITYLSFLIGEGYIYLISGQSFSLSTHLLVLLVIVLCTTSFSSLMYLIYVFVKTSSTIGGLTALTSSIGGFLAGVYITIGGLSGITKDIVSANPLAHATALVRSLLMKSQLLNVYEGLPNEVLENFSDSMGVNLYIGSAQLNNWIYVIVLSALAFTCFLVSYIKVSKDKL